MKKLSPKQQRYLIIGLVMLLLATGYGFYSWRIRLPFFALNSTENMDRLSAQITRTQGDLARVRYLNAWIAASMGIDGTSRGEVEPEKLLAKLDAACGQRELVFNSIAKRFGYETRRVSFFNVPMQLGHTAIEVKLHGRWRFFDPSTGIYFSKPGSRAPLSILEARRLYPHLVIQRASGKLYRTLWSTRQRIDYAPHETPMILHPKGKYPIMDIERTYFASAMNGVPEPAVLYSELMFDLAQEKTWAFGRVDGNQQDVASTALKAGEETLYAPLMQTLHNSSTLRTGRRFIFRTEIPRTVEFTLSTLHEVPSALVDLDHAALRFSQADTAIETTLRGTQQHFRFTVFPPYSSFLMRPRGKTDLLIDAYAWQAHDLPATPQP